jgi:hypothetical protein
VAAIDDDGDPALPAEPSVPAEHRANPSGPAAAGVSSALADEQMRAARREAEAYLEDAKQRAESIVTTMIAAIEREAEQLRREAEAGIQERWAEVEADAARHLEEARRVAASMLAERQQRIATLSDSISEHGAALAAGMEDAARIRAQFDEFVGALASTAARIAETAGGHPAEPHRAVAPEREPPGHRSD